MQVSLPILHHPKDGYAIDLNRLIDLTQIFKKRDTDIRRDFCVYIFIDRFGNMGYIGMGKYYTITIYSISKGLRSRPFNHRGDLLANTIDSTGTCIILGMGMTSIEAHVLEAYLIKVCAKKLSKYGTKEGDRESLINKKREKKWERLITEYLKLGNGDYTRLIA